MRTRLVVTLAISSFLLITTSVMAKTMKTENAAPANSCSSLPGHDALQKTLQDAQEANNGGIGLNMWGVIVDRTATVCAVAFTGNSLGDQWPGSRLIAAAKANTANAFSLDGMAMSTANLYAAAQPGGFLFGIQQNHPINETVAYKGPASAYGSAQDPAVGQVLGGATVFGGGFPLYNAQGKIVGGLGVSGDTACADHNIGWRTRHELDLDHVTKGPGKFSNDQIVYDLHGDKSKSGFGHPTCGGKEEDIAKQLPPISPPVQGKIAPAPDQAE